MHSEPQPLESWPEAIPALLRWTPASTAAARRLRARLVDASAERVGTVIGRHAASASETLDELLSLPRCERILLAPAITALVARDYAGRTDGGVDAWTCLTTALAAERTLASGTPAPRDLWTALGDAYLPAGASASEATWDTGAGWREDAPYHASHVLADTVIDAFSPGAVGWLPDIALGEGTFPRTAYDASVDKLRAACAVIDAASIHAAQTVGVIARVIVLRSDPQLGEFRAASSPIGIGRIVLRNPHVAGATVLEIVDGLVHETVHGLVDLIELDAPLVSAAFAGQQADSPWTGRALDIRTYLHACFVWYGLWHFWSLEASLGTDEALARRYMQLCTRGFVRDGGILAPINSHVGLLSAGVFDVLQQLQAEVTAS